MKDTTTIKEKEHITFHTEEKCGECGNDTFRIVEESGYEYVTTEFIGKQRIKLAISRISHICAKCGAFGGSCG